MQACIQAEIFLRFERKHALRTDYINHQIPRARADHTRYKQKGMQVEKSAAKGLLPGAHRARAEPCLVWNGAQIKLVDQIGPRDANSNQLVCNGIQNPKRFVHGDFQN